MILIIDLSEKKPKLVLKDKKIVDSFQWDGLFQLSETLLGNIDKFLKKNRLKLKDLDDFRVIEGNHSLISNRIARATVLGLKVGKY